MENLNSRPNFLTIIGRAIAKYADRSTPFIAARLERMYQAHMERAQMRLAPFMDRTTLGRNVLPLERDGLIKIEESAADGRAKELHLTKACEVRLQAGCEAWERAQARFEDRFGAKRAEDFRAM